MSKEQNLNILKQAELLFSETECQTAIKKIAHEISHTLQDDYPLILSVMGGAIVFTGQLLPHLNFPLEFDYIHVSRYRKALNPSDFHWLRSPHESVSQRHVLILDDILDEGHTMKAIHQKVMDLGAKTCKCAVFANKLLKHSKPITADFVGIDVPDRYVFGFGMDIQGSWRNLPAIYALNKEAEDHLRNHS